LESLIFLNWLLEAILIGMNLNFQLILSDFADGVKEFLT